MDKATLETWLKDYQTFWAQLPKPEQFKQWPGDFQSTIDSKLSDLKATLLSIDDSQLQALAQYMDQGDNGDPNANPPIPPTPPQPYMIKLIALCIVSGPIWLAERINYLLPTAADNATLLTWLFNEFSTAINSARAWYLSKQLQKPIGAMLDVWFHGSDADILTAYPKSQNTHSIDTLFHVMRLVTMLDDGSTAGQSYDPTPAQMKTMTNTIISTEAN